ncbi:MAG: trypsin-like peptidase domain-containing protein [Actinobacteria bacterium]|nr:trypsin-like peptidase domain-containing protein [Actinomycetota bacterium]
MTEEINSELTGAPHESVLTGLPSVPPVAPLGPPQAIEPYAASAAGPWREEQSPPAPRPEHSSTAAAPSSRRRGPLALVLVAAIVGGLVGGELVSAIRDGKSSVGTVQVSESSSNPGAALVGNGVSIPKLVSKALPKVVSIDVKAQGMEDQGTGMIISADGMVVTNNHVISPALSGAAKITVTQSGSTRVQTATLIGADPSNDVALLKIDNASDLPFVTFGNSDKLEVGDAVVAIGNALGLAAGTPTVTSGIVSALGRTVTASNGSTGTETITNMIQTDAAINPGNSGGPLMDSNGNVIGMNTAVAGSSSDGSSAQNIGFAIPASKIKLLLADLAKGGVVQKQKAYLGVQITTLTQGLRQQYGFKATSGAVILATVPRGPADTAGLKQGDIITKIGSVDVSAAENVTTALQQHKPGEKVDVEFWRGSDKQRVSVRLAGSPVASN